MSEYIQSLFHSPKVLATEETVLKYFEGTSAPASEDELTSLAGCTVPELVEALAIIKRYSGYSVKSKNVNGVTYYQVFYTKALDEWGFLHA